MTHSRELPANWGQTSFEKPAPNPEREKQNANIAYRDDLDKLVLRNYKFDHANPDQAAILEVTWENFKQDARKFEDLIGTIGGLPFAPTPDTVYGIRDKEKQAQVITALFELSKQEYTKVSSDIPLSKQAGDYAASLATVAEAYRNALI